MNQLGVDLGFYQVKTSTVNFDVKYPSVIGYPSAIELQNDTATEKPEDNIVLQVEGITYYIGDKAVRDTTSSQLTFLSDKTDSYTDRLKYLAALGLALGKNTSGAFKVVTGLPVDEFAGHNGLRDKLAQNMKGTFEFILNHVKRKVIVPEVITIPQCAAAYYDHIVDNTGKVIEKLVDPKTLVIDIGYRTTDIVAMAYAKYSPKESFTVLTGVSDIHKEIRRQLIRHFHVTKDLIEIDLIVRNKGMYINGTFVSIEPMLAEAARPYAEKIFSEIPLYIQNLPELHTVLLTGGGAHLLSIYVIEQFESRGVSVVVSPDAEYNNARGYFKYGLLIDQNKEAAK